MEKNVFFLICPLRAHFFFFLRFPIFLVFHKVGALFVPPLYPHFFFAPHLPYKPSYQFIFCNVFFSLKRLCLTWIFFHRILVGFFFALKDYLYSLTQLKSSFFYQGENTRFLLAHSSFGQKSQKTNNSL